MVEKLLFNYSEQMYYIACSPKTCSYSYTHGNTVLFFITITIGLFGGYNTMLQIIAPLIVRFTVKIKRKLHCSSANTSIQPARVWLEPEAIPGRAFSSRITRIQNL